MAGRKTLPTQLKEVKGTARKCRDRKTEAKQSQSGMQPPPTLRKRCHKYFFYIKTLVGEIGLDSESYSLIAAEAAVRLDEIDKCTTAIDKHGHVIVNGDRVYNNPAVAQRSEAMRHLHSLCTELGLTASALGKLAKMPEENKQQGFGGL